MVDVSVIIVSYNTKEITLACLQSVFEQTFGISFEIIVVDNNSKDYSAQAIAKNFPGVLLIQSSKNLGFALANNIASEKAKGEYLLLLNSDTIVLDNAIQKLYFFAQKHPFNGIYGGRTLNRDLSLNPSSCWRRPTLWSLICYSSGITAIFRRNNLFDPESYGSWRRDYEREVDIVSGCFLMIKKQLWSLLGGFSSQFFMYGEDADLCFRAIREGARPIITPEAVIVHYGGASEKVHTEKMIRLLRAKGLLLKEHWSSAEFFFGRFLFPLAAFSRMVSCFILCKIYPKKFNAKAKVWQEIWGRRSEWLVH
ncbi:MAG: glycosyltransferase family 2 protein [Clostridia bacterium]|nr:glycosyltransferase family 2 protein [Clostridia bacterium]